MSGAGIKIAGWNRLSFIDFPGSVSTVLFFPGCNLRCPYCHNPGVVLDGYSAVDVPAVFRYLEKHRDLVEGAVLSGGEPTIQPGLPAFADRLRTLGARIKLDTNGLLPGVTRELNPDYLALDIKTVPSRYPELGCTSADAEARLLLSIGIVKAMGANAEIRITVAPGFVDAGVMEALRETLAGVAKVFLQPCRTGAPLLDPEFAKTTPFSIEKIREFKKILDPVVGECVIRGLSGDTDRGSNHIF